MMIDRAWRGHTAGRYDGIVDRLPSSPPLGYFRLEGHPCHPPAEFSAHNACLLAAFCVLVGGLFSFSALLLITCLRA